ncbi:hypothetical protein ACIOEZ_34115 [Streptomyces sp. NPDC087866]|uniref:hypothetical protein n=1 Tax=Streptomyces sp. NPDC087866 TaxID=3365815 RepID=UPI00381BADA6
MSTARNWAVGVGLLVSVAASVTAAPYAVTWAWPGIDPDLLVVGNLFFGMILGTAAILGFMAWLWRDTSRPARGTKEAFTSARVRYERALDKASRTEGKR